MNLLQLYTSRTRVSVPWEWLDAMAVRGKTRCYVWAVAAGRTGLAAMLAQRHVFRSGLMVDRLRLDLPPYDGATMALLGAGVLSFDDPVVLAAIWRLPGWPVVRAEPGGCRIVARFVQPAGQPIAAIPVSLLIRPGMRLFVPAGADLTQVRRSGVLDVGEIREVSPQTGWVHAWVREPGAEPQRRRIAILDPARVEVLETSPEGGDPDDDNG